MHPSSTGGSHAKSRADRHYEFFAGRYCPISYRPVSWTIWSCLDASGSWRQSPPGPTVQWTSGTLQVQNASSPRSVVGRPAGPIDFPFWFLFIASCCWVVLEGIRNTSNDRMSWLCLWPYLHEEVSLGACSGDVRVPGRRLQGGSLHCGFNFQASQKRSKAIQRKCNSKEGCTQTNQETCKVQGA